MDQILSCVAEIDDGDTSSLPWLLEATALLAQHDDCESLSRIVGAILPLVCNVAACDDPSLSADAFFVLALILRGAPEQVGLSSESVNERALAEMCLVRSTDEDPAIAAPASACLSSLAALLPYGLGKTLAAFLEVGTLHDMPAVVLQCASVVERLVDGLPAAASPRGPVDADAELDGRLGLLMSALCLWAHGALDEVRHTAKLLVVKLGIRFSEDPAWEEAIANTDSVLLRMWNQGLDPSPEQAEELEREQQEAQRHEELLAGPHGASVAPHDPFQERAALRGWLVPGGRAAFACDAAAASMYPQVFALLGFRGRGGACVGVPAQSAFDVAGSYRRREVVKETRTVELSKILACGAVRVYEHSEVVVKEVTHLESLAGEFAHREKVKTSQVETVNGEALSDDVSRKQFVHFRNSTGEYSTFVDFASPTLGSPGSPQIGEAFAQPPHIVPIDDLDLDLKEEEEKEEEEEDEEGKTASATSAEAAEAAAAAAAATSAHANASARPSVTVHVQEPTSPAE